MTDPSTGTSSSLSKPSSPDSNGRADVAAKELETTVVEGAHDVGDGVKHLAKDMTASTKKGAEAQINRGKRKIVDGLGSVAGALRKTGEQLGEDDNEMLTGYLDTAADKIEDVSVYLKHRSIAHLAGDLGQFARREPALFIGGGLILGLFAGRFLKSASPSSGSSAPADTTPTTQRMGWQSPRQSGPRSSPGSTRESSNGGSPSSRGASSQPTPSSRNGGTKGVGQT